MVVNLYVDHMMARPPASAEEVWNATREHAKLYREAAHKIGLSTGEYQEFRNALLDGKALYVALPRHIDAMAGNRRGSVYSVRHAYLPRNVMGWRVALHNGATVYVPQTCGNLSVSRVSPAKHAPIVAGIKHPYVKYVPPLAMRETPVTFAPPPEVPPEAPPVVAPVLAAHAANLGWLAAVPLVGGLISIISHNSPPTPPYVPPCNNGSNQYNVCQSYSAPNQHVSLGR